LTRERVGSNSPSSMARWIWIGLGGGFGTLVRYAISLWAPRAFGATFPGGTLVVNVVGSFLIGTIMHVGLTTTMISPTTRLALTTGVMGGLTTYSTYNYETIRLVQQGTWGIAALNVALSFFGCLLAGFAGLALGRAISGG